MTTVRSRSRATSMSTIGMSLKFVSLFELIQWLTLGNNIFSPEGAVLQNNMTAVASELSEMKRLVLAMHK